ncbi:MAG: DUF3343 domain-containing protein [Defluviitaleaceae bacterium]|nr:DUF3343 domain-containing protein [Defluviitaleaceae bacterium]
MQNYIATFFSHYDALMFFNFLKEKNITAKLMPVPRKVSASCGTCVSYTSDSVSLAVNFSGYEIEAVYVEAEGRFLKFANHGNHDIMCAK